MDRPIFAPKKEGPKLSRIFLGVALVALAVYAGLYAWRYYRHDASTRAAAKAPSVIDDARALIDQGKLPEAKSRLTALVESSPKGGSTPEALVLLAEVAEEEGNDAEALALLRRAAFDFPANPNQPANAVAYGRKLEASGNVEEARRVYDDVRERATPAMRAPALTGLGRLKEIEGELEAARDLYREAVETAEWDSAAWNEALDELGEANIALIFSTQPTQDSDYYSVKPGDNLIGIGVKLNTTQGLLTRANGISEDATLQVGQRLKFTHKDFRIVIERDTRRLFLFDGSGLFKRYHVGLGREGHETTVGRYRIGDKQKNPDWFKPGEGRIPFGDPRNELGTRWMPMVPEEEGLPRDLGIHGTFEPESVGLFSSSGCARLANDQVEELYDLVVRATPVDVVERVNPDAAS